MQVLCYLGGKNLKRPFKQLKLINTLRLTLQSPASIRYFFGIHWELFVQKITDHMVWSISKPKLLASFSPWCYLCISDVIIQLTLISTWACAGTIVIRKDNKKCGGTTISKGVKKDKDISNLVLEVRKKKNCERKIN